MTQALGVVFFSFLAKVAQISSMLSIFFDRVSQEQSQSSLYFIFASSRLSLPVYFPFNDHFVFLA